jgi:hypothetical protein
MGWGSSVSISSGYGLDDRAIEIRSSAEAKGFLLSSLCPDGLWGIRSLLSNEYYEHYVVSLQYADVSEVRAASIIALIMETVSTSESPFQRGYTALYPRIQFSSYSPP